MIYFLAAYFMYSTRMKELLKNCQETRMKELLKNCQDTRNERASQKMSGHPK